MYTIKYLNQCVQTKELKYFCSNTFLFNHNCLYDNLLKLQIQQKQYTNWFELTIEMNLTPTK